MEKRYIMHVIYRVIQEVPLTFCRRVVVREHNKVTKPLLKNRKS